MSNKRVRSGITRVDMDYVVSCSNTSKSIKIIVLIWFRDF